MKIRKNLTCIGTSALKTFLAMGSLATISAVVRPLTVAQATSETAAIKKLDPRAVELICDDGVMVKANFVIVDGKIDAKPEIVLEMKNPGQASVETDFELHVTEMGASSRVSRIPPMARNVWKQPCNYVLSGGETRRVTVEADVTRSLAGHRGLGLVSGEKWKHSLGVRWISGLDRQVRLPQKSKLGAVSQARRNTVAKDVETQLRKSHEAVAPPREPNTAAVDVVARLRQQHKVRR